MCSRLFVLWDEYCVRKVLSFDLFSESLGSAERRQSCRDVKIWATWIFNPLWGYFRSSVKVSMAFCVRNRLKVIVFSIIHILAIVFKLRIRKSSEILFLLLIIYSKIRIIMSVFIIKDSFTNSQVSSVYPENFYYSAFMINWSIILQMQLNLKFIYLSGNTRMLFWRREKI